METYTDIGMLFLNHVASKGDHPEDILSKALAYYLFREIIEDVHAEYGIPDEKMEKMNRKAANRAKLFVQEIMGSNAMQMAFGVESIMCDKWDNPEITGDELRDLAVFKDLARELMRVKASSV